MKCQPGFAKLGVLRGVFLLVGVGLSQAQIPTVASGNVTFTVTAVGKTEGTSAIWKDDIQLFVDGEHEQIGDWKKDDNLFLPILIDESIDSSVASHWNDLTEFISAQPTTVHVAVGYIRNNAVILAQDFTTNHELAAEALHIPMGRSAFGSSSYLGTMDLLKRWPHTGPHRSVLLISSGQNNLGKLSEETGAESYYLGSGVPVSLKPYFDEIGSHLRNQYLLTFSGSGGAKGKFQNLKVKTEVPGVEFFAPSAVYLPPLK